MTYTILLGSNDGALDVYTQVGSLDEASREMRDFIEENGLGASHLSRDCGIVRDDKGVFVAKVSYNGRVWDPQGRMISDIHGGYPVREGFRNV
jgi:hypothetical protein